MAKRYLLHAVAFLMLTVFTACSDNSSGTEEADPPAIPNLEFAQPEVSYFTGFGFMAASEKTDISSQSISFSAAQSIILGVGSFSTFGPLYTDFIKDSGEATFKDGVWEWLYQMQFQGISMSIRLTAEEDGPVTNWEVFTDIEGIGEDLGEQNVMSGSTRNDGMQGKWTFNSFFEDSETPLLSSEWIAESETNREAVIKIYDGFSDSADDVVTRIDFSQSKSEYLMTIDFSDNAETADAEIFWNTDANIGYIIQNGEKKCWQGRGQNATDVPCQDVGL